MGVKRSSRACNDWKICAEVFVGFILIWAATNSFAATNPVDGKHGFLLFLILFTLFGCLETVRN